MPRTLTDAPPSRVTVIPPGEDPAALAETTDAMTAVLMPDEAPVDLLTADATVDIPVAESSFPSDTPDSVNELPNVDSAADWAPATDTPPITDSGPATLAPPRVPQVGDKVFLYFDETNCCRFDHEEATVERVHSPGDPTSALSLRIDWEDIQTYPIVSQRNLSSDQKRLRHWSLIDTDDGWPILEVPTEKPPIGSTNVCVWLPTTDGIRAIRGRVVDDPGDGNDPFLADGNLVIATPENRRQAAVPYCGGKPRHDTWGWHPVLDAIESTSPQES